MNLSFCTICPNPVLLYILVDTKNDAYFHNFNLVENKCVLNYVYALAY